MKTISKLLDNKWFGWVLLILFIFFMVYKPQVCIFLFCPYGFLLFLDYFIRLRRIDRYEERTVGTVVEFKRNSGYSEPVISFTTKSGENIEEKSPFFTSTNFPKIRSYKSKIGEKWEISYNRNQPEDFIIRKNITLINFGLIMGFIILMIFLLVGILWTLGKIELN